MTAMTSMTPNGEASGETNRRTVIVLFGGRSAEHDVSRTSAVAVFRSIDQSKYRVVPIGVDHNGLWSHSAHAESILTSIRNGIDPADLPRQVEIAGVATGPGGLLPMMSGTAQVEGSSELKDGDLVSAHASEELRAVVSAETFGTELPIVIPMLHGPFGEDGTVQGMLEMAGVPYVGAGVLSSAVAMDKSVAKELLAAAGLPQAQWISAAAWDIEVGSARDLFVKRAVEELGLPVFVKPANLGSSVGVSRATTIEAVGEAIELALGFDDFIVVEEGIVGREIEFAVLGNERPEVSVAGEVKPGADFYDYEDKYLDDNAVFFIPAPMPAEVQAEGQALALRAYKALRCEGMARVDFFLDDGSTGGPGRGWFVNEANTIPGFTPISQYPKLWEASGLSYPELLEKLLGHAVARHARRSGRVGRARK
jgi:D-alanine-D-alanine ligase